MTFLQPTRARFALPVLLLGVLISATHGWQAAIAADVLLVDDDDNSPDLRPFYEDALAAAGLDYDVVDTGNSDDEQVIIDALESVRAVIWFTGDAAGGPAGPSADSETALSQFLTDGRCLLVSSQDYVFDKGSLPHEPNAFMTEFLGVESAIDLAGHDRLEAGFGPYANLIQAGRPFEFDNAPAANGGIGLLGATDQLNPTTSAEVAFRSEENPGRAGVFKTTAEYHTTFLGFELGVVKRVEDRAAILGAFARQCELPKIFALAGDLNLFSLPSVVTDEFSTCAALTNFIGESSVDELSRLTAGSGEIERCEGAAGFLIEPGRGYFLRLASAQQVSFPRTESCPPIQLSPGANLISVPSPSPNMTCRGLLSVLQPVGVRAVQALNTETGLFETCAVAGDAIGGKDFSIVQGGAYLVSATRHARVTLPGCTSSIP